MSIRPSERELPEGLFLHYHIKALSAVAPLRLLSVHFNTPRDFNLRHLEIFLDLKLALGSP